MAKYKVRLAYRPGEDKPDVLAKLEEFDKKLFPGCKRDKPQNNYWWYVLDNETGEIVGYAGMEYLEDEQYGYFSRAGILAEHRGHGLHKRLIACRIKMAKRLGALGVITYVAPHNHASMNSLVSRGFRLYTPARRWAGSDFMYLALAFGGN